MVFWLFHLDIEMGGCKINGCKDGKIGVPLAAARPADGSYLFQRFCRHEIRKAEGLFRQRGGF